MSYMFVGRKNPNRKIKTFKTQSALEKAKRKTQGKSRSKIHFLDSISITYMMSACEQEVSQD